MLPTHLYVHVPFCARRCSYCDFSIAVRRTVPVSDYLGGIQRELVALIGPAGATSSSWNLSTVYLGGGTPSSLGAAGVRQMLATIASFAQIAPGAEVTIEANPEDVTPEAADAWAAAGVNRLSLGAQTFDDAVLTWMHRTHDASRIGHAVRYARSAGIVNISLDLIFALPPEIPRTWTRDLDETLALSPQHVSLYGLTVEPATPLQRWVSAGRVSSAGEDRYADEFLEAHQRMTGAGFVHYEVSNFAKPGRESRHNSAYWTGAPYVGIGPAAHSFDGERRRWNVKPYAQWLAALGRAESVVEGHELIDAESAKSERIYLGLRTQAGYRAGASDRAAAESWARAGWAVMDGDLVRLNAEGWLRLDSLAAGLTGL
ncbi:MAG: radical SAM family heme chaperone HemW [Gemmatimonadota bacterium]|nr:radical SAM family heme chaperone HemW [Gemmatimonadota bacterium]